MIQVNTPVDFLFYHPISRQKPNNKSARSTGENMSSNKTKILNQIDKHIHSSNINDDFTFLMNLQREQSPWLSKDLVEITVIQGIAKLYEDQELDFMLYEYMGSMYQESTEKTAA